MSVSPCYPFRTARLPLIYSGNPGVNDESDRGELRSKCNPFDTGCLPLIYSGNPGVNDESDRGLCQRETPGDRMFRKPRASLSTIAAPLLNTPARYAIDPWIATVTQGSPASFEGVTSPLQDAI